MNSTSRGADRSARRAFLPLLGFLLALTPAFALTPLPVTLPFDGTAPPGGVGERTGTDVGYTDVVPSPLASCGDSTPACDDPAYPYNPQAWPYYIPAKLLLDPTGGGGGGALIVTSTDGDNVLALNDQDNALAFRIDGSTAFVVKARILPPSAPNIPDVKYEGGGIFWAALTQPEQNYVKLVYAFNCDNIGGACLGVQFASEITGSFNGGTTATNPQLPAPSFAASLDLYLVADPQAHSATACYSIDGGPLATIGTRTGLPDAFFAAAGVYAGIATTNTPYSPSNGGTPFDTTFAWFALQEADADGDTHLDIGVCGGNDCDDGDPDIHPGASERCNGLDDDCDTSVDEDFNCDDADACTTDYCSAGECRHDPVSCDDAVACTDDSCEAVEGCENLPNDAHCPPGQVCDIVQGCIDEPECQGDEECADGIFCNGAERCASGQCQPGTPISCEDSNHCTADACDENADICTHLPVPEGTSCSDDDACNGAETCDAAGNCLPGTPVDCTHLDGPCSSGACNAETGLCEAHARPDGVLCGDDGNACDGEDVCRSGVCEVDDTSLGVVRLVPVDSSAYRARDIANNDYAPRFYTAAGDPDYSASDYGAASVEITFVRSAERFQGHLEASGLKPNFAYQVKLIGMPAAEYGSASDDLSNERIGYAGRWWRVGAGNSNDAAYEACQSDPQCEDIFEGYLVFDFFVTDRHGAASYDFIADQSLHVLWRVCPSGLSLTGCGGPGGTAPVYQDVVALAATGYGYEQDYATWNMGVYGEIERTPPQAYLPAGEYRARFVLTEESFHESGRGGTWAHALAEAGVHFWIVDSAGLRDCDDWNLCNGYESCDAAGSCLPGSPTDCSDADLCTDDACDPKTGCSHADNSARCNDQVACTVDTCDPVLECQNTPDDGLCAPGESCDPVHGCFQSCSSSTECDDGLFCNGAEWCDLDTHLCQAGIAVLCSDGQYCNGEEACNESSDSCVAGTPPNCSDGNSSTVDYCDPAAGACGNAPAFDPATGTISDSLWVSGMELGGIGVGKLEMMTNGEIANYTINNNWDREVGRTKGTFFALHVNQAGEKKTRMLRRNYNGGSDYSGVDNVDHLRYLGMFPQLKIDYYDNLPVSVRQTTFSPLIPQNPSDSSLPIAFFEFQVTNESDRATEVSLLFSWQNILGRGGYDTYGSGSATWNDVTGNQQELIDLGSLRGIRFRTTQSYGTIRDNVVGQYLLLAETGTGLEITTHSSWNVLGTAPPFWSAFSDSGTLTEPVDPPVGVPGSYEPAGAVAVKTTLAPSESKPVRFVLVWYMPTHITAYDGIDHGHAHLGNPATDTPEEIAQYALAQREAMRLATLEWQGLVLDSNLPFWLKLRMINGLFTMFANTVYPQNLEFYTHESLVSMGGSLGTMDQRMCFHPYYTMMFPGLDQEELTIFGDVQPGDGAISHFNGNVGYRLRSASVGYGITHWPDLSCSYVAQVLKNYRWTGDMAFLDANWADVKEAMAWLQAADTDGDFIPEGGSTYDYEGQSPGAFSYTASAYLGALKAAEELARIKGETTLADSYAARFVSARNTVMTNLWTGTYFRKYHRASPYASTQNSFIASLAGDWLSRLGTTGRTLDVDVAKSAENRLLNYHQDLFPGVVAPMEVDPSGYDPAGNCYQYQHEPYLGMQAITDGYVDEGLLVLYDIYKDHWEKARWPWNGRIHPSVYGSGKTGGWNGNYYMSNPATWGVLNALAGASIDLPGQTLHLAPHLPAGWTELHLPLFFPSFWAWLDFDHTTGLVELRILKTFGPPVTIVKTVAELASGVRVENTLEGLPFTASVDQVLTYHVPVDNTPPAAVSNLGALRVGDDVELRWTAPGDDGVAGRSLRYDIRYSESVISEANWEQAGRVTREGYPQPAGSAEIFTVPDTLPTGATLYFAMKSKDEEGNWSDLSNIAATSGCSSNEECDDLVFCNGEETCSAGSCLPGAPVDCSGWNQPCLQTGWCNEATDQCEATPVAEGSACDDGDPCTANDQCWSGVCQAATPLPQALTFGGGGGGIQDTGFTHLIPSTGGAYRPEKIDLDETAGVLTVTSTSGDFAREADGSQNDQDNPLALQFATGTAPFRVSARLVPPFDLVDDYQNGGLVFGIGEDDYVKVVLMHHHTAFGGAENGDPDHVGFQVGVEQAGSSVDEHNIPYPASDGFASVAAIDLHLEIDPLARTAEACYRADDGAIVGLVTDLVLDAGMFPGCSYAGAIETSNDYTSNVPEPPPWNPHFDSFAVRLADGDGDGYSVCGGDLDDGDETVHPGATEICDGRDNDQDGSIDEGGDALCDDADPCTEDHCTAGTCEHLPICFDISGVITYYRTSAGEGAEPGTERVGGVTLDLLGQTTSDATVSAEGTGGYAFLAQPPETIDVRPWRLGGFGNAISSLDASRVSQARVGLITLTANQTIAGDVSGNGAISSYDAGLISQLRVGIISRFPVAVSTGSDWAFAPVSRRYEPLDAHHGNEDYLAIAYGDVTGNWTPPLGFAAASVPPSAPAPPAGPPEGAVCILSLRPLPADGDGTRRVALVGDGCRGLIGLDLTLGSRGGRGELRGVSTTDLTRRFTVEANARAGRHELALFGAQPLAGDGDLLLLELDAARTARGAAGLHFVWAEADEGRLPVAFGPSEPTAWRSLEGRRPR